jgi:alpha-ribazole phosphatase/probable phosphoglycerate mutase
MPETTIDLIRHGEPEGGRMYRGWVDHRLSERGWRQMREATAHSPGWTQVVSSPLLRCWEFAGELAARLDLPLRADARIKEVRFGAWEGRTAQQICTDDPMALRRFFVDPVNARPEGAEPLADFNARVCAALNDLAKEFAGQHLLLVTHAGVIRVAIAQVLDAPLGAIYRTSVGSADLTRLRQTDERPLSLVFHGRRTA